MELSCVEKDLKNSLAEKYNDGRLLTIGRVAHITEGTKPGAGRATCQYRNRCRRGCPFGAYFSSNSSTLPMAEKNKKYDTKDQTCISEIIYDKDKKRATWC